MNAPQVCPGRPGKVAASQGHQILGVVMVLAAIVYLTHFVPRGWVPHDEGMIGQSAEQVLHGAIPHIDYQEAYTGGLTYLHAAVFKITGVDLLHVRWLLFAAASWAAFLIYAICRRYLAPAGAALAVWVAVGWSFPNYFAGLPSWWLLVFALACLWAVIRHVETQHWRYLVAAGLFVGLAIAIKQTGLYLLAALVLSLLYDGGRSHHDSSAVSRIERLVRWGVGAASIVLAAAILGLRILDTEGVYLFCPIAACGVVLFLRFKEDAEPSRARSPFMLAVIVTAVAALPLVPLLIPYMNRHRLGDFLYGAIVLPRTRLEFASTSMPWGVMAISTSAPLLTLAFLSSRCHVSAPSTLFKSLWWMLGIALPILALFDVTSYQLIWQSSRAFAVLVPLWICWRLAAGRVQRLDQRRILFVSAAILAWTSLNQFPFAAPIYFCYIAPLVVVAGIAAASGTSCFQRRTLLPWALMLILFAVLSANRAFIDSLGIAHLPRRFDTVLNLPRAHLRIRASEAEVYSRLMASIESRLRGGMLIAGPDCPEVYFLAGLTNPSGTIFEFISAGPVGLDQTDGAGAWSTGTVVVLNHAPQFSPAPSDMLSAKLRREFPHGEDIGRFEVRWR